MKTETFFWELKWLLPKKEIFISQQKYVIDLLKETRKTTCKPTSTLIDQNMKLGSIGEDIAGVSLVSQFMHQPKDAHLQVALIIV